MKVTQAVLISVCSYNVAVVRVFTTRAFIVGEFFRVAQRYTLNWATHVDLSSNLCGFLLAHGHVQCVHSSPFPSAHPASAPCVGQARDWLHALHSSDALHQSHDVSRGLSLHAPQHRCPFGPVLS